MSAVPAPRPALTRDPGAGLLGGVCAGLGRRLGLDPLLLRIVVIASSAAGGVGIVLYGLGWALLPKAASDEPGPRRAPGTATASLQVGLGVAFLLASLLLTLRQLGLWAGDPVVFPLVLAAGGIALVWRQGTQPLPVPELPSTPRAAETLPDAPAPRTARERRDEQLLGVYRGGFGVALIVGAGLLVLQTTGALSGARDLLLSTVVVVVAFVLILAPFLFRFGATLAAERAARIRSQERAEVAAHLHDSVLQTLALVQQQATDPRAVATLARRQERELRGWLEGERAPEGSFTGALRSAAADVEEQYAVPVDVVAVGDAALDSGLHAMLAATREAIVNAAKFGAGDGGPAVAVYAEATEQAVEVYVRDRGPGFDPEAVPADRRGVRESIVGRMERHGGTAIVHAAPGAGVEVELRMERRP
ncbi:MAG: PspC domain-containing protein [Solirubrobacterales bacterium]|nr:PspC domain-containing protein [Solirubrobacterales bacterium]